MELTTNLAANLKALELIQKGSPAAPKTFTADTTDTNPALANCTSLAGVAIGDTVTGAGIPAATTILAMDDVAHTMTLSANATATAATVALSAAGTAAGGGILDGCKVMTYSNDFTPDENTDLAALTESTYSGYAQKTVAAWGTAFFNPDTTAEVVSPVLQFNRTTGAVSETVFGYGILDPTGLILLAAERFDVPVEMNVVGDATVFVSRMTYPPSLGGIAA